MIRCLIISPDKSSRLIIESHIRIVKHLSHAKSCSSLTAARSYLFEKTIDILFIEIPALLTKEEKLIFSKIRHKPAVVVISNNIQIAKDAYELNASDFLLQPITHQRFLQAIAKVLIMQDYTTMEQFRNGTSVILLPAKNINGAGQEYNLADKSDKKQESG